MRDFANICTDLRDFADRSSRRSLGSTPRGRKSRQNLKRPLIGTSSASNATPSPVSTVFHGFFLTLLRRRSKIISRIKNSGRSSALNGKPKIRATLASTESIMNTDGRPKGASPRLRRGFFGRPKRKILSSSKRTSLRRMGKFGRFTGEEAEVSLRISHTKG